MALTALTFVLSLPLFAPWSVWVLGYVVFVPWLIVVCSSERSGWVYLCSYLLGAAFFLTHWRWLFSTTPPGYLAGSLWFGLYFPLAAWLVRHLYRRRALNVAIAFPVVWTLTEMMRSHGPLAFPWFLLGHSQIRLLPVCQIADITGVCGVSFLVAVVNGVIVDLLLARGPIVAPTRSPRVPGMMTTGFAVAMLLGSVIYGRARMSEENTTSGPKVAVLQGDFVLSTEDDPSAPKDPQKQAAYLDLIAQAAENKPDLIVLPETPWGLYLNRELRQFPSRAEVVQEARAAHASFQQLATRHQAGIVVGSMSLEPQPSGTYPQTHRYNSAFVYGPAGGEPGRYDKIHLVLFGEYVPFRYSTLLHPIYRWLNSITPWGADGFEYSLTDGKSFSVFGTPTPEGAAADRRFGITICYEDVIPQVFRRFIVDAGGNKRVDFMLNISNDGWFGHGTQQPQHLVNCAFRAIENRVGIARAVNTGVSGFIAPSGRWYNLVGPSNRPQAGGTGFSTANLLIDARTTFYSRSGDLFGLIVACFALLALADAVLFPWRQRRRKRHLERGAT